MAKDCKSGRERKGSMILLRLFLGKLQKSLSLYRRPYLEDEDEGTEGESYVAEDVKEGHFVVLAMEGGKSKRFVVELGYLTNPDFLKLLEEAEEEFGFEHEGALAIPCRPDDLQRILGGSRKDENGGGGGGSGGGYKWGYSCKATMIGSYQALFGFY